MKRILFFITHKTLDLNHADLCFKSISNQIDIGLLFDKMYIYNSHSEELPNDEIIDLFNKYNLKRFIKEIEIFEYDDNTPKTLGSDIKVISNYFKDNYKNNDRILLLKSDCLLSINYFKELNKLNDNKDVYFTAPFILSKKSTCNDDIIKYLNREEFTKSDDITFFVEDQIGSKNNDLNNRDIDISDKSIKFISCLVINDFSCHYLTNKIMKYLKIKSQSWGGVNLKQLNNYYIGSDRCFIIHQYHDIKSENRSIDREGPVHRWLND